MTKEARNRHRQRQRGQGHQLDTIERQPTPWGRAVPHLLRVKTRCLLAPTVDEQERVERHGRSANPGDLLSPFGPPLE